MASDPDAELLELLEAEAVDRFRTHGPRRPNDGTVEILVQDRIVRVLTGLKRCHADPRPADPEPIAVPGFLAPPGRVSLKGLHAQTEGPSEPEPERRGPPPRPRPPARNLEDDAAERARLNNEASIARAEAKCGYQDSTGW